MSNKLAGLGIKSLKELIAIQQDEKKLKASKAEALIIKKEAKLSSQVKAAQVKVIEAKEALVEGITSEHSDDAALVLNLKSAQDTYDSYKAVYDALFPNA